MLIAFPVFSQTPSYNWAGGIGGPYDDFSQAVKTDANGNAYTAGVFEGPADFDPGPGTQLLGTGGKNAFLLKVSPSGNLVWVKHWPLGSNFVSEAWDLEIDSLNNVYIAGLFRDSLDMDPGPGTDIRRSNGSLDAFVIKLNSAGNYQWSKTFGGNGAETCKGIHLDYMGNIFLTGGFNDTVDFDPGNGVFELGAGFFSNIYILKLNPNGDFSWAHGLGSFSSQEGIDISSDGLGAVYCTGHTSGTVDFDPGPGIVNVTTNGPGVYVAKYQGNGDLQWAFGIATGFTGQQHSIDYHKGKIVLGGVTGYGADFDPDTSNTVIPSTFAGINGFVSQYDSSGNYEWVKLIKGRKPYWCHDAVYDQYGNVYASGSFQDTLFLDPSTPQSGLISRGEYDVFVAKFDRNGGFAWVKQMGGIFSDEGLGIALDQNEDIITTGTYQFIADMDPGPAVQNVMTGTGGFTDFFIQKMSQCQAVGMARTDTGCNPYVSPSGNHIWTSPGTYYDYIHFPNGCDSIIQLNISLITVDTSLDGQNLTALAQNAGFQWLRMDSNGVFHIMPGDTNATLFPNNSGIYAVQITQFGCVDTSRAVTITVLDALNDGLILDVNIFPNPSSGDFKIQTMGMFHYRLLNTKGRILEKKKAEDHVIVGEELEPGIYFLQIWNEKGRADLKIVKE